MLSATIAGRTLWDFLVCQARARMILHPPVFVMKCLSVSTGYVRLSEQRLTSPQTLILTCCSHKVDINSILNYDVWEQTVAECGADGSNCNDPTAINAPVCDYIKKGTFNPGADSVSAFSLRCVPADGIGQTS